MCILLTRRSEGPFGQLLEAEGSPFVGEGQAAGEEHGSGGLVPGAVLVVAHQGEAAAGELYPDLMTAACMEPDPDQRSITCGESF